MNWDVTSVVATGKTTLMVTFRDGLHGEITFEPSYFRGALTPLSDPAFFREVRVVDDAISWPGELDLAPDALHESLRTAGPLKSITLA